MSHLKQYINQMTNPELIGLAKNRFLDTEDQVAIAKHHYRRAHNYLIENSSLSRAARDVLWGYKGYARKCEIIAYGHCIEDQDKYHELYDNYADTIRNRSPWRLSRVFLAHNRWYSHGAVGHTEQTGTPASIIEDIYKRDVLPMRGKSGDRYNYYYPSPRFLEQAIVKNPNTPLELVVQISASAEDDQTRAMALKTMANRS